MPDIGVYGPPGLSAQRPTGYRRILAGGHYTYVPGGKIINGLLSRDSGNTSYIETLRSGLLMGRITSSGKYAPTVIGVITGAYTSGGTSLTVTAAQAVELVRRIGASGTGYVIGPPTAAGTVAVTALTYSAVNTSTGVITCTSLGVDKIAGSWVCDDLGCHIPREFITEDDFGGIRVTDIDGTGIDRDWANVPDAGQIDVSQLLYYPSDTSMIRWLKDQLNNVADHKFTFDDSV